MMAYDVMMSLLIHPPPYLPLAPLSFLCPPLSFSSLHFFISLVVSFGGEGGDRIYVLLAFLELISP